MTLRSRITLLLFTIILSACSSTSTPTPALLPATILPPINFISPGNRVVASGIFIPAQSVRLGFTLTGQVKMVAVSVGNEVHTGQILATLDGSVLDATVLEAQAVLNAAQIQYNYLKRVGTAKEHLQAAQADVDRAQAVLDSTRAIQSQATLYTPIDGTVVSMDITPGETVIPGQVVMVIGDLKQMQVETTDLSEQDVPRVKLGQPATVYIVALDKEINGKVIEVARQATTIGGDVVYKVTISLDEQWEDLRWGMSVEVTIKKIE
ncbi:MAG: efflux RND transporter periplasmic adaptor subunit [Anaerolineales bacterium]|nr:efflux RND transporter periplasmic adaptor subunit [Anaerolineales bacterium]